MRARHGEAHKRFDAEEMGESRWIYVDIALAHLSARAQRNLQKTINFGMSYGMGAVRVYESFSRRTMESPQWSRPASRSITGSHALSWS